MKRGSPDDLPTEQTGTMEWTSEWSHHRSWIVAHRGICLVTYAPTPSILTQHAALSRLCPWPSYNGNIAPRHFSDENWNYTQKPPELIFLDQQQQPFGRGFLDQWAVCIKSFGKQRKVCLLGCNGPNGAFIHAYNIKLPLPNKRPLNCVHCTHFLIICSCYFF